MKKDISPTGQGMTTLFERILSGEIPSTPWPVAKAGMHFSTFSHGVKATRW